MILMMKKKIMEVLSGYGITPAHSWKDYGRKESYHKDLRRKALIERIRIPFFPGGKR